MPRDPYPGHGRRRRWWVLWTVGCWCGMDAYPCLVEQMLATSIRDDAVSAEQVYTSGLEYARWWRDDERRRWTRESR